VVTFLGHVDHGKTSLLDRILGLDVVSSESGGITQHIRAYQVSKSGRTISFVDTPGHEAFTEMRARGANVTDIAVLVVAADDGVMPQTEEAISHARAAAVPIVVALNKIDLPGVDTNRSLQQLSANDLLPSEWGGDVEVVKTSAVTGEGIDELLETLLTVAELHDYKANPHRPALGTCLEAQQEAGRGVVCKLIVQNGTLHVGDIVVCGQAHGRVKAMYDTLRVHELLDDAGPSVPVTVAGFDVAPEAGEAFYVLDDISLAREIAQQKADQRRQLTLGGGQRHVTLENLFERLGEGAESQTLHLILRADVRGSIEAIEKELSKLEHPEVRIRILQKMVGGITEADVHLADASDAIIIGFNVVPDEGARVLADERGVQIRRYDVIYKITDDLRAALEGMLKPEERQIELGRALVQQTFSISRVGVVAGCRVLSGTIERNARVRVIRNNTVIGDYRLESLKREKDDAREVREGMECGMKLGGFDDIKEGDILEAYRIEEVGRKLDQK
jgi:translation initiation factor IF-2